MATACKQFINSAACRADAHGVPSRRAQHVGPTHIATIVQIANYENGSAQFTVSVNQDGSVSGFYVEAV